MLVSTACGGLLKISIEPLIKKYVPDNMIRFGTLNVIVIVGYVQVGKGGGQEYFRPYVVVFVCVDTMTNYLLHGTLHVMIYQAENVVTDQRKLGGAPGFIRKVRLDFIK